MTSTARGIIRREHEVLMMERWRDGLHYFSIPGGHIEPGETSEQALIREIMEETTISVQAERLVFELRDTTSRHFIYLCKYIAGEPVLPPESEEAGAAARGNYFKPQWVDVATLGKLPFGYWQPLQAMLIEGLRDGFDFSVKVVTAAKAR